MSRTVQEDDTSSLTLRQLASQSARPLCIGTAILPAPLFNYEHGKKEKEARGDIAVESKYSQIVRTEFNAIVIEHHLKWSPLCESLPGPHHDESKCNRPGRYDFHYVDRMVDYAVQHDMKIKGHVLIWHVTSPSYLEGMDAPTLRKEMRRHIFTVIGRYKHEIKMWDVVNESLAPDGTLAKNIFYRVLGEDYIEEAFRMAHEADPTAFLIYNDNKVEGVKSPKSEAFYQLLKKLREKDVPIHGAGMQAHFNAAGTGLNRIPAPTCIRKQIKRIGELGLKVNISEMDVRVSKLPKNDVVEMKNGAKMNIKNYAQSEIYRDVLAAAFAEPAFDGIWFWGFTDKHTWVKNFYYEDQPLLFDSNYGKKESYYGVKEALNTLPKSGGTGSNIMKDDLEEDGNTWGYKWMQPDPQSKSKSREELFNKEKKSGDDKPDWLQS